jgi:hypothetical protein
MTLQGILMINIIAIGLLFWVANLVRKGRLYVGYGVIMILSILGIQIIVSVPRLLFLITHLVGAVFPVSALTMLALGFIVVMLVYILTQLTIISNRLAMLTQAIAIERTHEEYVTRAEEVPSTGKTS